MEAAESDQLVLLTLNMVGTGYQDRLITFFFSILVVRHLPRGFVCNHCYVYYSHV